MRTASTIIPKLLQRSVQTLYRNGYTNSYSTSFPTREFEEIQVIVPWGQISGKWYGPRDKRPIVGLHGWQDNAGTFDTLAPLLPPHIGFLAIDLPGHGLSSWLPEGCTYHSIDYIKTFFTLMREFNWDKISMICHSMSAINGFIFTSLFPDKCDMFVSLDIFNPIMAVRQQIINSLIRKLGVPDTLAEISNHKRAPPCYEYNDLVERLHNGSGKSISKECCQFILQRNIKPSEKDPNKYYFSRDARLKMIIFNVPFDILGQMAGRIKCPHLMIKTKKSAEYEKEPEFAEVMNLLKQNPVFENQEVDGTHHIHLNESQKIADIVNPFIIKYRPE